MSTPVAHINQRRFGMTRIPQVNYETPTASGGSNYVKLIATDQNLASVTPNVQNNRDHATGHAQPTEQWIISHESGRQFDVQVCSEEIGRLLYLAFGKVVTSTPDVTNAPNVRKHVFSPLDVSTQRQVAVTTLVEQLASVIDRKFPSMACASLGFRGDASDRIAASCSFQGSGEVISPSGITIPDFAAGSLHYLYNSQAQLEVQDAGILTHYGVTKRLNSWAFDVANELLADDGYRPGASRFQTAGDPESGALRSEMLLGNQTFSAAFNARMRSQDDELAALKAQRPLRWQVSLIGGEIEATPGEVQTITFSDTPTAGNFTIGVRRHNGTFQTTANIAFGAASAAIDAALEALTNVGAGNVTAVRAGDVITITFTGALVGEDIPPVIFTPVGLVAGSEPVTGEVATTTEGAYHHRLDITGYRTVYQAVEVGNRNGLVSVDVRPTMLYDGAAAKQVEAVLWNEVASYTV